jgi:hypothetical protein
MPTDININSISGSSPYKIYLCNTPKTFCVYIDTISTTPYQFQVPTIMINDNEFVLKVVDNNNCTTFSFLTL